MSRIQMIKTTSQRGISLVEMMLVVTVIAVMSATGVQMMQRSVENSRIERTATQMQNMSIAARNYYERYREWPTRPQLDAYVATGFSGRHTNNPWGKSITLTRPTPPQAVSITTSVPTPRAAKLLFAKLPLSVYDPDCTSDCDISMYFNKPIKPAWEDGAVKLASVKDITKMSVTEGSREVVADDKLDRNTELDLKPPTNCTAGMTPKAAAGIVEFGRWDTRGHSDSGPDLTQWIGRFALCFTDSHDDVCNNRKPSRANHVKLAMQGTFEQWESWADIVVIRYCDPTP